MPQPEPSAPAPVEIERKFLVVGDEWRQGAEVEQISQGYVAIQDGCSVRVRLRAQEAFLTIKGPPKDGMRAEFEYSIPVDHAALMLHQFCTGRMIAKRRHSLDHGGRLWTVDEFEGPLAGLLMAEVELDQVGQAILLPPWVGREVTDDPRYLNSALSTATAPPAL
ncbi:MAG TPA: CYTH domain-containing protein [Aliidongia sp.]|uniref:CYTH domain-containing protein n=1 Tax=Aliidongia sp. TaxID=1914230 RepID=UPI002DDDB478|nr:CYTH domain-containing protein [Aliidongia sp.]HEV2677681.1 CYTH domain-containing protein [Aliidongia sp.]